MAQIDLTKLTLTGARESLRRGDFSSLELVEAYLSAVEEKNSKLNAYLEVFADEARAAARAADERQRQGKGLGELDGLPIAVKDNILIEGHIASAGSKILKSYRAAYNATVIKKLKAAGAIFLGRTNMDEFAMGSSTENSAYGPTKNPRDETRVPGGSSGGSAAVVAADLALAALGSDTGGSIRQPAAFCGAVGLKPTYGAVSRFGLMAMASSLDQIGTITKTVADAELLFDIIKGRDPLDSTSAATTNYQPPISKLRVGVPWHFFQDSLSSDVLGNFKQALKCLEQAGHKVREVDLPNVKYALPCYYVLIPAEVSANLARYDGLRYGDHQSGDDLLGDYLKTRGRGFGPEVRRRIMLGTYVLSAGYYDVYYGQAQKVAGLIRAELAQVFTGVEAIATPTTPTAAFKLGEKTADPLQMYLADIFTVPANIAGLPAISIPSGDDSSGLPLGLQLMSAAGREDILFSLGQDFEHARPLP